MNSSEENTVPAPSDVDYVEIVQSNVKKDKKFLEEDGLPAKINYYCRHCKKIVSAKRMDKKLSFKCAECGDNVSFGSETSIHNYYKVRKKIEE